MSDADFTPGREPRNVAASLNIIVVVIISSRSNNTSYSQLTWQSNAHVTRFLVRCLVAGFMWIMSLYFQQKNDQLDREYKK